MNPNMDFHVSRLSETLLTIRTAERLLVRMSPEMNLVRCASPKSFPTGFALVWPIEIVKEGYLSPVCKRSCSTKWPFVVNLFPQCWH